MAVTQTLTFRGTDGFAGIRHGQAYAVEVSKDDGGTGEVWVSMPYAPEKGPARFSAKQWAEWWGGS